MILPKIIMMKKKYIAVLMIFFNFSVHPLIPQIGVDDIIFLKADSGYDLYIRKLKGIESILLTDSQKDPMMKKTNYALRTDKFYPANGDEIRILDGKELHTGYEAFYLVDSTVENYPGLGQAFHFFLPEKLYFGYDWTRNGTISIQPGIMINLRLFGKKYSDYSGGFIDQWITLKINYTASNYRPGLIEDSQRLTDQTDGTTAIQTEKYDLKTILDEFADSIPANNNADVVFIVDTTESMMEEIPVFKREYPLIKKKLAEKINNLRIGVILYKDYGDIYLTKVSALTSDFKVIDGTIDGIVPLGGQDIPEARNEAVFELNKFDFRSVNRFALLVTDAPAHITPRGKVTLDDAVKTLTEKSIKLELVCLQYK
jgi:hypothetical protein